MTIYNKTTLQNFRKENLVEIVKHQEDEIAKLNQEKEILQCDLDNANSKLRESMSIRLKAIEILKKDIVAYISRDPLDEVIERVILTLEGKNQNDQRKE